MSCATTQNPQQLTSLRQLGKYSQLHLPLLVQMILFCTTFFVKNVQVSIPEKMTCTRVKPRIQRQVGQVLIEVMLGLVKIRLFLNISMVLVIPFEKIMNRDETLLASREEYWIQKKQSYEKGINRQK